MDSFEGCMKLEAYYAQCEFEAVKARDYQAAAHFHALRWKCMDAAVLLVEVKP